MLTLGSLFAGIGGFEIAATWAGIRPVWSNEIDPFCCKVLRKNFDHEIIEKDIRSCGKHNLKKVDIITGGFPCQPFSCAGKRKGTKDDRYLWPEMLRIIQELRPKWVIGENVADIISMDDGKTFENILIDLENEGYRTETYLIPACGVGAWHRRNRVWIIAHCSTQRSFQSSKKQQSKQFNANGFKGRISSNSNKFNDNVSGLHTSKVSQQKKAKIQYDTNAIGERLEVEQCERKNHEQKFQATKRICDGGELWKVEPGMGRVVDGLSNRVDRIKGLGNAIVPQLVYQIFKAVLKYENER